MVGQASPLEEVMDTVLVVELLRSPPLCKKQGPRKLAEGWRKLRVWSCGGIAGCRIKDTMI